RREEREVAAVAQHRAAPGPHLPFTSETWKASRVGYRSRLSRRTSWWGPGAKVRRGVRATVRPPFLASSATFALRVTRKETVSRIPFSFERTFRSSGGSRCTFAFGGSAIGFCS